MIDNDTKNILTPPLKILYGSNYLRISVIIVLVLISIISFLLVSYVGFVIAVLGLYCLSMIAFIKFPGFYLYEDHFEIVKKSVITKLTDKLVFKYSDIENIEFSKGFTNWFMSILTSLLTAHESGYGFPRDEQYSKSDSMIITTIDNKKFHIKRFGSRIDFISMIETIKMKI